MAVATTIPTSQPRAAPLRFAAQCGLLLAAFFVYHLVLVWLMRHQGLTLGAFGPGKSVTRLVPVYMHWEFHLKTGLLAALAMLVGFLAWFARRGWSGLGGWRLAAILVGFHLLIASSVAMIDGGPQRLVRSYEQLSATDYYGAVPQVKSAREFLADYPRLMPRLPLHCQTHPPGGVLFLWLVAQGFGTGATAAVLAMIGTSGLVVPAVYFLARETLAERPARLATALFMLAPSIVLFSATCLDAVFMVPIVWAMFFLWKMRSQRAMVWGVLAGAAAFLASLLTYSASFLAVWFLFVVGFTAACDRARLKNTLLGMATASVSAAALYFCLWIVSGYDPWATFTTALQGHARIMAGGNHATLRQHGHLAIANLAAFLFCAGIPLAVLWARRVSAAAIAVERDRGWIFDVSFVAAVALIDLAPLYTLEVEHIWLFMVPGVAIAAARSIESDAPRPSTLAALALALQAAQTVLMEVCLNTVW
jgi:methylthioxylose transferase